MNISSNLLFSLSFDKIKNHARYHFSCRFWKTDTGRTLRYAKMFGENCRWENDNGKYFPAIDESVSSYKDIIVTSNRKENPNDRFGALGDLNYAIITEKIEDEIFVTPSDTTYWHSFSLKSFYEFQKKFPNDFVMVVRDVMDKNVIRGRFGNPVMNKKNIITSFVEKPDEPASTLVAAPFYIYRKKHIALLRQYLHEGGNPDSPGMIIPYLLKHKQTVRGFIVKNKIIDAGTPQDIEEAKKY